MEWYTPFGVRAEARSLDAEKLALDGSAPRLPWSGGVSQQGRRLTHPAGVRRKTAPA